MSAERFTAWAVKMKKRGKLLCRCYVTVRKQTVLYRIKEKNASPPPRPHGREIKDAVAGGRRRGFSASRAVRHHKCFDIPRAKRGGFRFALRRFLLCFVAFFILPCGCHVSLLSDEMKRPQGKTLKRYKNPSPFPQNAAGAVTNRRKAERPRKRPPLRSKKCRYIQKPHEKPPPKAEQKGGRNFPCRPAHRRQMLLSILKR